MNVSISAKVIGIKCLSIQTFYLLKDQMISKIIIYVDLLRLFSIFT